MKRKGNRPRRKVRILIADDHPVVRQGLRAMLSTEEMEVVGEAANGLEAVRLTRALRPDVVLMDLRMPEMDGLAATRAIRQESPETHVVVITSFETKEHLRQAIEAGASGYLAKGVGRDLLINGIRMLREGGSLVDSRLLAELVAVGPAYAEEEAESSDARQTLAKLTPRELKVLELLTHGLTNKEIAQEMHYSVGTVKNVVQLVIDKLGVADRTQAAVLAVRAGLDVK